MYSIINRNSTYQYMKKLTYITDTSIFMDSKLILAESTILSNNLTSFWQQCTARNVTFFKG